MIPEAGCWIFMGALNEAGYGIVGLGGRGAGTDRAHRVTYRHFKGPIPDGMFVCHRCDVPSCCNPEHLFLGTNQDNVDDCVAKGRQSPPPRNTHLIGEACPAARIKADDVLAIRARVAAGERQLDLSREYGLSTGHVSLIVNRKVWASV